MAKTVSKGLTRLAETDPERSYKAWTSPLYRWLDAHCEEIAMLRYERRWSWERLVSAAIEDGVCVENNSATRKKCRKLFSLIRSPRKATEQTDRTAIASASEPGTFAPSRVPADWRPASVEAAYSSHSPKKINSVSEKAVSVADQPETLRSDPGNRKETPEERAARLTNEIEEKLFAQKRARGPGFLME